MEKIIAILNGDQSDRPVIDFAAYIAKLTHSRLTGLFVDNEVSHNLRPLPHRYQYLEETVLTGTKYAEATIKMDVDQKVRLFKNSCEGREVNCNASVVKGSPIENVVRESRFADLLIVEADTKFNNRTEAIPTHFVKEVISNAECPVIIAPEAFEGIDEIVFCYDGSRSAMFAMKQFTYLFPQYHTLNATLLEIKDSDSYVHEGDDRKVLSWLKMHYKVAEPQVIKGDIKSTMLLYFLQKKNVFVVMGAYGRNALSYFFKKSSADIFMRVVDLPLFVAHS